MFVLVKEPLHWSPLLRSSNGNVPCKVLAHDRSSLWPQWGHWLGLWYHTQGVYWSTVLRGGAPWIGLFYSDLMEHSFVFQYKKTNSGLLYIIQMHHAVELMVLEHHYPGHLVILNNLRALGSIIEPKMPSLKHTELNQSREPSMPSYISALLPLSGEKQL